MAYRPPIHYPRQAARPDARSVARAALERRALVEALKQRLTLILQLVGAQGAIQRPQVPLAPPAAPAFIPRPRVGGPVGPVAPPVRPAGPPGLGPDFGPYGQAGISRPAGMAPGLWSWVGNPDFYEQAPRFGNRS